MTVFDAISSQMRQLGAPLFAVTLSAVPRPDTPLLLMLHWHGFRPAGPGRTSAGGPAAGEPAALPTSVLQLGERWLALESVEREVLDAAWQLGAWNLERQERRGCNTVGASAREALECQQAFGEFPGPGAAAALVEEAPDRPDLLQLAARVGYVRWQFRPVAGGLWPASGGDDTLGAEGYRDPPCPVLPRARHARNPRAAAATVYRLGSVHRIAY